MTTMIAREAALLALLATKDCPNCDGTGYVAADHHMPACACVDQRMADMPVHLYDIVGRPVIDMRRYRRRADWRQAADAALDAKCALLSYALDPRNTIADRALAVRRLHHWTHEPLDDGPDEMVVLSNAETIMDLLT